jgi:uncharacterized iron-regulated protein
MTRNRIPVAVLALIVALTALPAMGDEIDKPYRMEIGDPARKTQKADLVLDAITDTRTGDLLSPAQLAERLADKRIVFMGESHTDIFFHRAQLQVIQALHDAGREVLIGLEMYPYTKQELLDNWVAGRYTEEGFLEISQWYEAWGYHWDYYRSIFLFAKENGLPMYGLNTPREIIAAVRKKGFDELTEEEQAQMPPDIDTDNADHLELFKAYFEGEDFHSSMTDEQWMGMFSAQCTWDATFGNNALKALEKHPDPNAILVVLVGSGHVTYDLGIQRQIAQWEQVPMATVIPISVVDGDGVAIPQVQSSYADFLWGMPPVTDPIYPSLGISTRSTGDEGQRTVIFIGEGTVGEKAGFQMGDMLVSMDGHPITNKEALAILMSQKRWGDTAVVKVQRGEEEVDLNLAFRRTVQPEGE